MSGHFSEYYSKPADPRIRWSDETPRECVQCERIFADNDDVLWHRDEPWCETCGGRLIGEALAEGLQEWAWDMDEIIRRGTA